MVHFEERDLEKLRKRTWDCKRKNKAYNGGAETYSSQQRSFNLHLVLPEDWEGKGLEKKNLGCCWGRKKWGWGINTRNLISGPWILLRKWQSCESPHAGFRLLSQERCWVWRKQFGTISHSCGQMRKEINPQAQWNDLSSHLTEV